MGHKRLSQSSLSKWFRTEDVFLSERVILRLKEMENAADDKESR